MLFRWHPGPLELLGHHVRRQWAWLVLRQGVPKTHAPQYIPDRDYNISRTNSQEAVVYWLGWCWSYQVARTWSCAICTPDKSSGRTCPGGLALFVVLAYPVCMGHRHRRIYQCARLERGAILHESRENVKKVRQSQLQRKLWGPKLSFHPKLDHDHRTWLSDSASLGKSQNRIFKGQNISQMRFRLRFMKAEQGANCLKKQNRQKVTTSHRQPPVRVKQHHHMKDCTNYFQHFVKSDSNLGMIIGRSFIMRHLAATIIYKCAG